MLGISNFDLVFYDPNRTFGYTTHVRKLKNFSPSVSYLTTGNLFIFSAIAECFHCVAWQLDKDNITGKWKPPQNLAFHFHKNNTKQVLIQPQANQSFSIVRSRQGIVINIISTFPLLAFGFFFCNQWWPYIEYCFKVELNEFYALTVLARQERYTLVLQRF